MPKPYRELKAVGLAGASVLLTMIALWGEPLLKRPFRPAPSDQELGEPRDSAAFFSARNEVTIRIPRDMTVDEFVELYRLEHVRSAIPAVLRAGSPVTVPLTPSGEVQYGAR